jgi:hypothetical protein
MVTSGSHPDDIVIQRQVHSPAIYVLGRVDGALQCSYRSYAEALAQATRLARSERVDVFYSDGEFVFERLARHRSAAS